MCRAKLIGSIDLSSLCISNSEFIVKSSEFQYPSHPYILYILYPYILYILLILSAG